MKKVFYWFLDLFRRKAKARIKKQIDELPKPQYVVIDALADCSTEELELCFQRAQKNAADAASEVQLRDSKSCLISTAPGWDANDLFTCDYLAISVSHCDDFDFFMYFIPHPAEICGVVLASEKFQEEDWDNRRFYVKYAWERAIKDFKRLLR